MPATSTMLNSNYNGHLYCNPKPLMKLLILEESQCSFYFIDGHSFTITISLPSYFEKIDKILHNVAAAPVLTLNSKFQSQMPENYLHETFVECMTTSSFWEHGSEVTVIKKPFLHFFLDCIRRTLQHYSS